MFWAGFFAEEMGLKIRRIVNILSVKIALVSGSLSEKCLGFFIIIVRTFVYFFGIGILLDYIFWI